VRQLSINGGVRLLSNTNPVRDSTKPIELIRVRDPHPIPTLTSNRSTPSRLKRATTTFSEIKQPFRPSNPKG
jgi:hypothetical protein